MIYTYTLVHNHIIFHCGYMYTVKPLNKHKRQARSEAQKKLWLLNLCYCLRIQGVQVLQLNIIHICWCAWYATAADWPPASIEELTARLTQRSAAPFNEESLQNDEMVKFYTGVPNIKVLKTVFGLVMKDASSSDTSRLSPFQEFVATLLKLCLNCPAKDLGILSQCIVYYCIPEVDYCDG